MKERLLNDFIIKLLMLKESEDEIAYIYRDGDKLLLIGLDGAFDFLTSDEVPDVIFYFLPDRTIMPLNEVQRKCEVVIKYWDEKMKKRQKPEVGVELVGSYWIDENDNKWSCEDCSKEKAEEASRTLIECFGCTNSFYSIKCVYCRDCCSCISCIGCTDCESCNSCTDCSSCFNICGGEGLMYHSGEN